MKSLIPLFLANLLGTALHAAPDPDFYRDGYAPPLFFAIGHVAKPPVLDGNLSDWPTDTATFLLGQNTQTARRFPWTGTKDASGSIRLAWDENYLYLGADVIDDQLSQAVSGAEPWQGDTFELFFNTFPRQQRLDGFWQEAIIPGLNPGVKIKAIGPQKNFIGVEGTAKTHPGGYTFECRIPWKNLGGFHAVAGTNIGFQLFLDDRDGTGRKTQLVWYPSSLSFVHPTDTNVLELRENGDTSSPKVLAGTNEWLVNDANNMGVSAIADVVGAKMATVTAIPPFPAGAPTTAPASVTFDLQTIGERASAGQGTLTVTGMEGLYHFEVKVADADGKTLAENTFLAQVAGAKFQRMRGYFDSLKKRVDALKTHAGLDEQQVASVSHWDTRVNDSVYNEARADAINLTLLDQMLTEYAAIDHALTVLESGGDPYAGVTGSIVRAYRSPLTGNFRRYALEIPAGYDASKKYPLIVFLHPIYADERTLSSLAQGLKDLGAIVYQGAAYSQFDWGGISGAETMAGLDEVKKRYNIDEDRVYLCGYHIGGRGTWQLAEATPDQWAAIAPIFQGLDAWPNYPALQFYPQFFAEAAHPQLPIFVPPPKPEPIDDPLLRKMYEQDSLATRLDNIASIPMVSAYCEDNPAAGAERLAMQAELKKLGYPLATRYVPGGVHGTTAQEFDNPDFYRWLLSHQRPAYPKEVKYVATNLRHHAAWWVSIDQFASPADTATIAANLDGTNIAVTTEKASALSLLLDTRLAPAGTSLAISIDGKAMSAANVSDTPTWVHFIRKADGWAQGEVAAGEKQPGVSGPIDDFQWGRFLFVYGTQGTDAEKTAMEQQGKALADWGLGAVFNAKADRDVTDADMRESHLLLIGTPANNSVLAKIGEQLPLKWTAKGFKLGERTVEGPGAGACVIVPNPLAPSRYAVVISGVDAAGYQVWQTRAPGGDYVLGKTVAGQFTPTVRGWFDNKWQWAADLCLKPMKN